MKFTIDMNTFIGIVSLVVAVGSYIYTWHFNHFSVDIVNKYAEIIDGRKKINFSVINLSTRPFLITNIELTSGQTVIHDNGFNVEQFEEEKRQKSIEEWDQKHNLRLPSGIEIPSDINPYLTPTGLLRQTPEESENFEGKEYVLPTERSEFSYFVDEVPDTITVTSNVRISFFSHSKSFVVHFDQQ